MKKSVGKIAAIASPTMPIAKIALISVGPQNAKSALTMPAAKSEMTKTVRLPKRYASGPVASAPTMDATMIAVRNAPQSGTRSR